MAKRDEIWTDDFAEIPDRRPYCVGLLTAIIAFVSFQYVGLLLIPATKSDAIDDTLVICPPSDVGEDLRSSGGGMFVAWVGAEIHKLRNRVFLHTRSSVESLAAISWRVE